MIVADENFTLPWDKAVSILSRDCFSEYPQKEVWDWCVNLESDGKFYCQSYNDHTNKIHINKYWFTNPEDELLFRMRWSHAIS